MAPFLFFQLRLLGNNLMRGSLMRFDKVLEEAEEELRVSFKLRSRFDDSARRILEDVGRAYRLGGGGEELVFVGIHIR